MMAVRQTGTRLSKTWSFTVEKRKFHCVSSFRPKSIESWFQTYWNPNSRSTVRAYLRNYRHWPVQQLQLLMYQCKKWHKQLVCWPVILLFNQSDKDNSWMWYSTELSTTDREVVGGFQFNKFLSLHMSPRLVCSATHVSLWQHGQTNSAKTSIRRYW